MEALCALNYDATMIQSLDDVREAALARVRCMGVGEGALSTFGYSEQSGRMHIETDGDGYHYIVCERGSELERRTTTDLEALLYWLCSDVAFGMGVAYEFAQRDPAKDCRRMIFARQSALLQQISQQWAERCAQEQALTLQKNPYDDLAGLRATLTRTLREKGYTQAQAWQAALAQYPMP